MFVIRIVKKTNATEQVFSLVYTVSGKK